LSEHVSHHPRQDATGKYQPIEWARRAISLYRQWGADRIVAEANQGGQMVETTVRTVDANVSFKAVHASRGKITRAEPISALFEQKRAHLVGSFPELEDELCTFAPGSSASPDRLDAMTWGLSDLVLATSSADAWIDHYRSLARAAPAPKFDDEGDPLPWRTGLGSRSAANALTKLYLTTLADSMRPVDAQPAACSRCGEQIGERAPRATDGFESWHVECRPN
jgi:Terminase RNaseH-like domain